MGTLVRGSRTTRKPLDSVASWALGRLTFKTCLLTGAFPFISAPVIDWPPCGGAPLFSASIEVAESAPIHSARKNLFFSMTGFLIFIGLLRVPGGRSRGFLWHGDDARAIRRHQIFVRHALHVFFRHGCNFVQTGVNEVWIVVINRPDADVDGAIERGLYFVNKITLARVLGFLNLP